MKNSPILHREELPVSRLSEGSLSSLPDTDGLESSLDLRRIDGDSSQSSEGLLGLVKLSLLGEVGGRLGGEGETDEEEESPNEPKGEREAKRERVRSVVEEQGEETRWRDRIFSLDRNWDLPRDGSTVVLHSVVNTVAEEDTL